MTDLTIRYVAWTVPLVTSIHESEQNDEEDDNVSIVSENDDQCVQKHRFEVKEAGVSVYCKKIRIKKVGVVWRFGCDLGLL